MQRCGVAVAGGLVSLHAPTPRDTRWVKLGNGPRRGRVDLTPRSRRQAVHTDRPNTCPHQSQRWEANARRHTANLTVLAFAQREFEPRRRNLGAIADRWIARPKVTRLIDESCTDRFRLEIPKVYAVTQLGECRLGRGAFDLRPIDLRELMTRIRDACLQRAIVRQQQQSFAVGIEAARWVHVCDVDVIGKRAAAGFRAKLTDDTERLVESDQHA